MNATTIKSIKAGTYFTFVEFEEPKEKQVWVRGEYCRDLKLYECYKFEDVNHTIFCKGTRKCYTDFYF